MNNEPIKHDEHSETKKPSSLKILLLTFIPVLVGWFLLVVAPDGHDEIGYLYFAANGICSLAAGYKLAKLGELNRFARVLIAVVIGTVLFVINAAIIYFVDLTFFHKG